MAIQDYRLLAEYANDIIWFFGEDGRILEANAAAVNSYGYSRDELLRMNVRDLRMPETLATFPSQFEEALRAPVRFETVHRRKDGSVFPVEISAQNMESGDEKVILSIVRDVSLRKSLEQQLTHQAFHDSLTQLPNRALFHDRMEHALKARRRRNCQIAVMFMDLDRFKTINDSMGHATGDKLLIEVAERLRTCLRIEDTLCRLGGDEFAILLEEVSSEGATTYLARRILQQLEKPFYLQGHELYMSASIGIVESTDECDQADLLLQQADMAMYQAKQGGRGRYVFFNPAMSEKVEERLQIETELRYALQRGQFEVYYQPILSLETGCVTGVEALARWLHPKYGYLSPNEFIPMQEQIGLIEAFTLWMIREAQDQCLRWESLGYRLDLSINLSPYNLLDAHFAERLSTLLGETGFPAQRQKLEITENAVMMDPTRAGEMLLRLNEMGFYLTIDDFGTGFSSLSYLRRLPVHEIKIDRSFVLGMNTHNEDDIAVVRAIVDLAQCLRKKVVAEGVENRRVWDVLNLLGCNAAQGFYMSVPMDGERATKWLKTLPSDMKVIGVH